MSHHLSGPDLRSPAGDASLDLTDLFAFPAVRGNRSALIMNVNPYAPERAGTFHPDAVYRINVDTDGDHQADIAYSFVFSELRDGEQTCTVHRAVGKQARLHAATGRITSDHIGPHADLLRGFRYLGKPHPVHAVAT